MEAIIRPFRNEDEVSVLELANEYASFDGSTTAADLAVTVRFPNCFLVAELENEIVGYAYGYPNELPDEVLAKWKASRVGYVESMAVQPSQRRKGIGSALLLKLLEGFRGIGIDMIILNCPAEAVDARRLYERLGFQTRFIGMQRRV